METGYGLTRIREEKVCGTMVEDADGGGGGGDGDDDWDDRDRWLG